MKSPADILAGINQRLNGHAACPDGKSRGECPIVEFAGSTPGGTHRWSAVIHLYGRGAPITSAEVAGWITELGGTCVLVQHVLHDELNGDRDGRDPDVGTTWNVDFTLPYRGQKMPVDRSGLDKVLEQLDRKKLLDQLWGLCGSDNDEALKHMLDALEQAHNAAWDKVYA